MVHAATVSLEGQAHLARFQIEHPHPTVTAARDDVLALKNKKQKTNLKQG